LVIVILVLGGGAYTAYQEYAGRGKKGKKSAY
jgi:hypothetical protein